MTTNDYTGVLAEVRQATADVVKACDAIDPTLFHEVRDAEASTRLDAGGFGPTGQFRFAPEAERMKALGRFRAEVDLEIGQRIGILETRVHGISTILPAVEEVLADPPSPQECYCRRHNVTTIAPAQAIELEVLEELRRARFASEFATVPAREILAQYERALQKPHESLNASVVRLTEEAVAGGRLPKAGTAEDAQALTKLQKRIAEARDNRLPEECRAWREAVKRARKTFRMADAGGIKPIRPQVG